MPGQWWRAARSVVGKINYLNEGDLAGIQFRKTRHFYQVVTFVVRLLCVD